MQTKQLDETLNGRMVELRQALDLSQAAFGKTISEPQSTIAYLELNQRILTGRHIRKICETFNVNPTWFILGKGEMFLDGEHSGKELVEELSKKFQLTEPQLQIINFLLHLPETQREEIVGSFLKLLTVVKPLIEAYDTFKSGSLEMPDISRLPMEDRMALIQQARNLLAKDTTNES